MELIETLNKRLKEHYGRFEDGRPNWRLVYSDDEFEMRPKDNMLVPKYRQWIHHKWILERLFPVPQINAEELATKTSYEPIWVFEDAVGKPLPPKWEAIQVVITTVYNAMARAGSGQVRYKEEEILKATDGEAYEERLNRIQGELFGNETNTGDALAHRQAIVVPPNYKVN